MRARDSSEKNDSSMLTLCQQIRLQICNRFCFAASSLSLGLPSQCNGKNVAEMKHALPSHDKSQLLAKEIFNIFITYILIYLQYIFLIYLIYLLCF